MIIFQMTGERKKRQESDGVYGREAEQATSTSRQPSEISNRRSTLERGNNEEEKGDSSRIMMGLDSGGPSLFFTIILSWRMDESEI